MEPKQAWGAFSIMVILADAVFVSAMIDLGYEPALVVAAALIALLVYFYVLYKRYHVEVVPENDIVQFQDPDDLRILCSIYGLETKGTELELRRRLVDFANSQGDRAFIWVAPRVVQSVGSALEIPQTQNTRHEGSAKSLLGGRGSTSARVLGISVCPVCNARAPRKGSICAECGADLKFYLALGESKVGKRVLSEKAVEVRRKPRYQVPSLREDR